jgi:hypothetical protein
MWANTKINAPKKAATVRCNFSDTIATITPIKIDTAMTAENPSIEAHLNYVY